MMTETLRILSAVLPGVLLLACILWADRKQPEPWQLIVKGVVCGIISLGVMRLFWFYMPDYFAWAAMKDTMIEKLRDAFLYAAIPEEMAKLMMLWAVVSRNSFFDEPRDGIVYAVCVGLGFATLENIDYISAYENWAGIALSRATVSVPVHYLCAVLMGYYYANARFWPSRGMRPLAVVKNLSHPSTVAWHFRQHGHHHYLEAMGAMYLSTFCLDPRGLAPPSLQLSG